ncbi:hypothetical protein J3R30DRAFT_565826 [Lentinula aciculospora]|uniref:Uncharacterized protein n=1 Tax=Lentinula aciculospora TaxID=153920 RepID=A0A9W9A7P2_9AGAR|nr:hypothetical protein J3R30DRAFT_565826 [Lentinula aciculospora]
MRIFSLAYLFLGLLSVVHTAPLVSRNDRLESTHLYMRGAEQSHTMPGAFSSEDDSHKAISHKAISHKAISHKAIITAFYSVNAREPRLSRFPPGLPTSNHDRVPNKIKRRVHEFFKDRFKLLATEVEFGEDAVYAMDADDPFQMDVTWKGSGKKWRAVVEIQEKRTTTHQTGRAVNDTVRQSGTRELHQLD